MIIRLFYLFATIAAGLWWFLQIVHSVLFLILAFFTSAGLFCFWAASFWR